MEHAFAADAAPLPSLLQDRFEACLGRSARAITIRTGRLADRRTEKLGTIACAQAGSIYLHGTAPRPDTAAGLWLLAHEAAHIVQQARAHGDATNAEAEADAAAAAVLAGRAFRCRSALPRHVPACWDSSGHYYTIYLLGLGAGLDAKLAARIAYYCQLPDLADELDAKEAGYAAVGHTVTFRDDARERQIQVGLHALSGEKVGREFQKWVHILGRFSPYIEDEILPFGLALHAFGDSYSHRNSEGVMYRPPFGHAPTGEPDVIGPEREKLYLEYCDKAYAFLRHAGRDSDPRGKLGVGTVFGNTFLNVAKSTAGEPTQIQYLRNAAVQLGTPMNSWSWDGKLKDFDKLAPPAEVPLKGKMLIDCYRYAREWSAAASTFIG
jgi:Domain of unknown function (DUF4157)